MTIRNQRALRVASALSALALSASTAWAQISVTGDVEAGGRQLYGDRTSAKFLEYRSVPDGFFLSRLNLTMDWGETGYFASLLATDALEGDQSIQLRAGRSGRYQLTLGFDKTPHLFSNTATSIYRVERPGVYTIPDSIQALLRRVLTTDTDPVTPGTQPDLPRLQGLIAGMSRPVNVALARERNSARIRFTPTPEWDVHVGYARERQTGSRPFGATFGFSAQEQLEPIDYTSHEFTASAERSSSRLTVRAEYSGSFFRNMVDVLVFDNPFREVDISTAPSRGRMVLYPDNEAHLGTLTAQLSLPLRSRWTTSLGYGVMTQNDSLQPFTINPVIANVPALPAATAGGRFTTLQLNSALTMRPARTVTFGLRYRLYDRDNRGGNLFTNYVRTDERLAGVVRFSLPYAFRTRNASAEATWQLARSVSVKGAYEWEGWDREFRETHSTSENTLAGMVDVSRGGWLFLRASVRRSDREAHDYDGHHVAEVTFPLGEPGLGQIAGLRKLDQANRLRTRRELIARVNPTDALTVTANWSQNDNDYPDSPYGLLENTLRSPSVGFSYGRGPVTLYGDYTREENRWTVRSRQRSPTNDKEINDWVTNIRDLAHTYGAGLSGELVPGTLGVDLGYQFSDADGRTGTFTPQTPDLVTTAADYPLVLSNLGLLRLSAWYRVAPRATLKLQYAQERYGQRDWAMDVMEPFMGLLDAASAGTTWVGVRRPGYRVHTLSATLAYRL